MSDYWREPECVLPLFSTAEKPESKTHGNAGEAVVQVKSARAHHESIDNQKKVLSELRAGELLTKTEWEGRDECLGKRLAPVIYKLRMDFGLHIAGHGKKADPYYMPDVKALPTLAQVSDDMKQAYYETSHWQLTREKRFRRDSHSCVLCFSHDSLACHHVTYSRLFGEWMQDLMTVCTECHEVIHSSCSMKFPGGIHVKYAAQLGWKGSPAWVLP